MGLHGTFRGALAGGFGLGGLRLRGGNLVRELLLAGPGCIVRRHRSHLGLLGPSGPATLANPRGAADPVAEVVELRAADVAAGGHLDALDLRRVQGERPLHAYAEGLLAHRERLAHTGALALDHDALEDLRAASLSLDHLEVDADAVARLESGDATQLSALNAVDESGHE